MKSSKRLVFFGALAITLFAGTFFLIIAPANRKRDALQADSDRKLATLARLNDDAAGSAGINLKIADVRRSIAGFESKLPPARELNNVVEGIWRLAEANSLHPRTLKTSAGKRIGKYWAQEADFSVSGADPSLYQFVLQLEKSFAGVRVEKMIINRTGARDGDMQVEMTLGVFLQVEQSAASPKMANVSIDPTVTR